MRKQRCPIYFTDNKYKPSTYMRSDILLRLRIQSTKFLGIGSLHLGEETASKNVKKKKNPNNLDLHCLVW